MRFELIPAYDKKAEIKELFTEYTDMLIAGEPSFIDYLGIQNYDEEVAHLEKKYGRPGGRLYLLLVNDAVAGCVGLRKMDKEKCELKRLYVRPEYRGQELGALLLDRIMNDAKRIGYKYMYLDTLPFLGTALKMYQHRGFYEIEKYNDSPLDSTIYMRCEL